MCVCVLRRRYKYDELFSTIAARSLWKVPGILHKGSHTRKLPAGESPWKPSGGGSLNQKTNTPPLASYTRNEPCGSISGQLSGSNAITQSELALLCIEEDSFQHTDDVGP